MYKSIKTIRKQTEYTDLTNGYFRFHLGTLRTLRKLTNTIRSDKNSANPETYICTDTYINIFTLREMIFR